MFASYKGKRRALRKGFEFEMALFMCSKCFLVMLHFV